MALPRSLAFKKIKFAVLDTHFARLAKISLLFAVATLVILLLDPASALAEEISSDRWTPEREDVLNFKFGFAQPSLSITTQPNAGDSSSVEFLPNSGSKTYVGFGYRNLGFYLSKSNPRTDEQNATYGAGDATDVLVQLFGRTWTQQYFYQSYHGYYIANTAAIDPSAAPNSYIKRPDISTSHYGFDFIYNFQPGNYSTSAAFNQSGRQLTSGGAWLAMVGVHNHVFRSQPQLFPTQVAANYGELQTLQRGDLLQLSVGAGGGYTLSTDGFWFLSGQMLLGASGVYESFETAEYEYHKSDFGKLVVATFAGGFNGVNHHATMQVALDSANYNLPATELQITSVQVIFQYGYRFEGVDLPWANRWSAWLDDVL